MMPEPPNRPIAKDVANFPEILGGRQIVPPVEKDGLSEEVRLAATRAWLRAERERNGEEGTASEHS